MLSKYQKSWLYTILCLTHSVAMPRAAQGVLFVLLSREKKKPKKKKIELKFEKIIIIITEPSPRQAQ